MCSAYFLSARMAIDQPMQCHSNDYSPDQLRHGGLQKRPPPPSTTCATAWARSGFDRGMQAYFEAWKFKHPGAGRFAQQRSKRAQGRTSSWFFDGLVPTTDQTDYALTGAKVHWHVTAADHRQKQRRTRGAVVAARPARRWGVGGHRLVSRHCQGRSARSQRPGIRKRTELTTTA